MIQRTLLLGNSGKRLMGKITKEKKEILYEGQTKYIYKSTPPTSLVGHPTSSLRMSTD